VTDIYYSQSVDEATNIGLGASKAMYQDFTKPNESSGIVMQYMSLEEGQQNPMRLWVQKHEKRSEEHTSELQSRFDLVCRLLHEINNKLKQKTEVNDNSNR